MLLISENQIGNPVSVSAGKMRIKPHEKGYNPLDHCLSC